MTGPSESAVDVVLRRSFWPLFAGFAAIVVLFMRDRACADHLNLLPAVARMPPAAWLVAAWYTTACCWTAASYRSFVAAAGRLMPDPRAIRNVSRGSWVRFLMMLAAFAIDALPMSIVRWLAQAVGACAAR